MRKPVSERKSVSALQQFLMETDFKNVISFLHKTKASWSISRPQVINDRKQSNAYRARIHIDGGFEYKASGDTAQAAVCNVVAQFLSNEKGDYHTLQPLVENGAQAANQDCPQD